MRRITVSAMLILATVPAADLVGAAAPALIYEKTDYSFAPRGWEVAQRPGFFSRFDTRARYAIQAMREGAYVQEFDLQVLKTGNYAPVRIGITGRIAVTVYFNRIMIDYCRAPGQIIYRKEGLKLAGDRAYHFKLSYSHGGPPGVRLVISEREKVVLDTDTISALSGGVLLPPLPALDHAHVFFELCGGNTSTMEFTGKHVVEHDQEKEGIYIHSTNVKNRLDYTIEYLVRNMAIYGLEQHKPDVQRVLKRSEMPVLVKTDGVISIDGKLSENAWSSAPRMADFVQITDMESPASQRTEAYLIYDDRFLYVGIKCHEENMENLKYADWHQHDDPLWNDDCAELFIDPANNMNNYYHIIVNCAGVIYDALSIGVGKARMENWSSDAEAAVSKAADSWTVELALPFSALAIKPEKGEVWRINVARERYAGKSEFSSWAPLRNFNAPARFNEILMDGPIVDRGCKMYILGRGELTRKGSTFNKNLLRIRAVNDGPDKLAYDVVNTTYVGGKRTAERTAAFGVFGGETREFVLDYVVKEAPGETVRFDLRTKKGVSVYTNSASTFTVPKVTQAWSVKDPLYRELLSDVGPGISAEGVPCWMHGLSYWEAREMAMQAGMRYSYDEFLKMCEDNRLNPQRMLIGRYAKGQEYDLRWVLQLPGPGRGDFLWDPDVRASQLQRVRKYLSEHPKHLWAIYMGDELIGAYPAELLKQMSGKDVPEYVKRICADARRDYGSGKYGIPESTTDREPLRWLVLRRWVNAFFVEWIREVRETVDAINPHVRIISWDESAGLRQFEISRYAPYCDIFTQQLYGSYPTRQVFAFHTKLMADLTGKAAFPTAHIENYAAQYSPEEIRELFSQVFRVGGRGFYFYPSDVRGRRGQGFYTIHDCYGAPDRWQAIFEILDRIYHMNQVRMPQRADTAVFLSTDAYMAIPGDTATSGPAKQMEGVFTLLGPYLRTWFKFVSDAMLADGKADLADYKVIYIPYALYQNEALVKDFIRYVKDGNVLVCGDPHAFSFGIDGKDLTPLREELFGTSAGSGKAKVFRSLVVKNNEHFPQLPVGKTIKLAGKCAAISSAGAETLVESDDGTPLIVCRKVGKGRAILFGFQPFHLRTVEKPEVRDLFKGLQLAGGGSVGHDIWRFKFPPFERLDWRAPSGRCLTNNYLFWEQNTPHYVSNLVTNGSYSYTLAPDSIPDAGAERGQISFDAGDLTDRKGILQEKCQASINDYGKDLAGRMKDWVVRWEKEDAFSVVFDFRTPYHLKEVRLWYSGKLPRIVLSGSTNSAKWQRIGGTAAQPFTEDVLDHAIPCGGGEAFRYLKVDLDKRMPNEPLVLAEAEVWRKCSGAAATTTVDQGNLDD